MDMLQVVFDWMTRFFRKFEETFSKPDPQPTDVSALRLDDLGRMTVVTVGPGFEFHLRNVASFTVRPSRYSSGFGFDIETADREKVAHDREVSTACDEILSSLRKKGESGD